MTSLLLIFSFLIHIILLLGMYSLYKEVQSLKKLNSNANEIADVFESYLKEIKIENERLLRENITRSSGDTRTRKHGDTKVKPITGNVYEPSIEGPTLLNKIKHEDKLNTTLESQVLQLTSHGYSSQEIAEKLNCGKTEAELIIKLHAKVKS